MGWRNNGTGPCKGCPDRYPGCHDHCERFKGCPDRYPGCHDHCERFKEWHEKIAARNKAEREFRISQDVVSDRAKKEMWKKLRYNRKSRPPR